MARQNRDSPAYVICRKCDKRFRAISVFHLRRIHGYDGEHPVLDYKVEFRLTFAMCRDSRRRIGEAKDDFWEKRGQHWTPDDVLGEIRRLHAAGKSLRGQKVPNRLATSACRLFGSWRKAVEAAGFDYERVTGVRRWSREKVVAEIRRLARSGVPLDSTTVKRQHPALHKAAIRLFPSSWTKALRAAGLDPAGHKLARGVWTRQTAEQWVRTRAAGKESIVARDVPRDLRRFVYQGLGTGWVEFVESVMGRPYPGVKKRRDWTRQTVLAEIRRLKAAGNPLGSRAVVAAVGQALVKQARKFFGSWDAALTAAGV